MQPNVSTDYNNMAKDRAMKYAGDAIHVIKKLFN